MIAWPLLESGAHILRDQRPWEDVTIHFEKYSVTFTCFVYPLLFGGNHDCFHDNLKIRCRFRKSHFGGLKVITGGVGLVWGKK